MSTELTDTKNLEAWLKQAIFEGFVEVPMLPEVASRAFELALDPEVSAREMADLIEADQSLAGHVMRIANSVAYTPHANLTSLQQAIARLGMRVISEIALTAALGSKLFHTPGYEAYVEYNWQHALATSLWAREIAQQTDVEPNTAFLAGLLHSIGRPAVLQTLLELAQQHQQTLTPETVYFLENKYSQPVTELVVMRWGMPQQVIEAVKPFQPDQQDDNASEVSAAVHAASRLASYMLDIAAEDDSETLLELSAFERLGLSEAQVEDLLEMEDSIQQRLSALSL
jgi:HD-like signal output (HDOD) protein